MSIISYDYRAILIWRTTASGFWAASTVDFYDMEALGLDKYMEEFNMTKGEQ